MVCEVGGPSPATSQDAEVWAALGKVRLELLGSAILPSVEWSLAHLRAGEGEDKAWYKTPPDAKETQVPRNLRKFLPQGFDKASGRGEVLILDLALGNTRLGLGLPASKIVSAGCRERGQGPLAMPGSVRCSWVHL